MTQPNSTQLSEVKILRLLDEASAGEWPVFRAVRSALTYHALRLLAFRVPGQERFAIVFDYLVGSTEDELCLLRTVVSNDGEVFSWRSAELYLEEPWDPEEENCLVGPTCEVELTAADLEQYAPPLATESVRKEMLYTLLVRRYLHEDPDAFWIDPQELVTALHSDFDLSGHELLLEAREFEHVVGTKWVEDSPSETESTWAVLPSQSPVYQSLARAIVASDASLFDPGVSNLHWKLHVDSALSRHA